MARLIFLATLENDPKAVAREAHAIATFLTKNSRLDPKVCRERGLRSAQASAERQRQEALGMAPWQVEQALERIRNSIFTPAELAVARAEDALELALYSDAYDSADRVRAARRALAEAKKGLAQ